MTHRLLEGGYSPARFTWNTSGNNYLYYYYYRSHMRVSTRLQFFKNFVGPTTDIVLYYTINSTKYELGRTYLLYWWKVAHVHGSTSRKTILRNPLLMIEVHFKASINQNVIMWLIIICLKILTSQQWEKVKVW